MTEVPSFAEVVDLLTKYDKVAPRDLQLLKVLVGTLKSTIKVGGENVFVKLLTSKSVSVYSLTERMEALTRHGFNRHAKTKEGLTLLEWVVENLGDENLSILNAVIPDSSDLNAAYVKVNTPIVAAPRPFCVVKKSAVPTLRDQFLLLTAVRKGKLRFVQALLAANASVTLPDIGAKQTQTLAHAAAQRGFYNILKLLIEKNADVKKAFVQETPLMAAAAGVARGGPNEQNFQQCIELLNPRLPAPIPHVIPALQVKREREGAIAAAGDAPSAKRVKSGECVICLSKSAEVAFLPCGHLCVCSDCVSRAKKHCPMCQKQFTSYAKIFIP